MTTQKMSPDLRAASGALDEDDIGYQPICLQDTINPELCQILALADLCLEEHNRHWARFVATGDPDAFRLAAAARQDRAQLLAEVAR